MKIRRKSYFAINQKAELIKTEKNKKIKKGAFILRRQACRLDRQDRLLVLWM
jgi:hypothetical protein